MSANFFATEPENVRARFQKEGEVAALHVRAMFDLSLTMIEAELGWIEGFIDELRAEQVPGT